MSHVALVIFMLAVTIIATYKFSKLMLYVDACGKLQEVQWMIYYHPYCAAGVDI